MQEKKILVSPVNLLSVLYNLLIKSRVLSLIPLPVPEDTIPKIGKDLPGPV